MKPKLTLRDLFWLVLVCALALGWWLDHSRLEKEQRKLLQWIIDEPSRWSDYEVSLGDEHRARDTEFLSQKTN